MTLLVPLALHACLLANPAAPPNLLRNGDFELPELQRKHLEQTGAWSAYGLTAKDIDVRIVDGAGRNASRGLAYQRSASTKANVHVDQLVDVARNSVYEVAAWVRCEGDLRPLLSVTRMDWKPLGTAVCPRGDAWTEVRLAFDSGDNTRVRLEWFPGAEAKLYTAVAGRCWLDDVTLRPMPDVPASLRQAFAVLRPRPAEEVEPAARTAGAVGSPTPLRPIVCRDGVLRYADGGEVALWGVNLQPALSWEYEGRLKPAGIPWKAAALKRVADAALDELRPIEAQYIRAHLLPSDFADHDGNLVDTIYLDVLDHLIAQCHQRGVYVYLTLANAMGSHHVRDSFMAGHERHTWLFDEPFVAHLENYLRKIVNHVNRYTGVAYRDEPAIALFEVINEPEYLDYADLVGNPAHAAYRQAFDSWCQAHGVREYRDTCFRAYRYELVRRTVDRLAAAIRGTGSPKPVVWNLNWPQMIGDHEDVFQAVADSRVDGVSFCLYPGQADVPSQYWNHPTDLSPRNYLPYLRQSYTNYAMLRWLLGKRFAGKAKLTYEFETFYNTSSYLYPAMARLFRGLGSQMAAMWQYTLPLAARYCGGSHYLNLDGSPAKALSFRIASRAFRESPRWAAYDTQAETEMRFDHVWLSYPERRSMYCSPQALIYSQPMDGTPQVVGPRQELAGIGGSALVRYDGSGAYFLSVQDGQIALQIRPDVAYLRPLWQTPGHWPWTPGCRFDDATPHPFVLHLPGWDGALQIERESAGGSETPRTFTGAVELAPGQYRISLSRRDKSH